MSDTQHKSINRTKIDRRIDKHFMQSYWSALQFPPTNLPVLYRGMPQASHGKRKELQTWLPWSLETEYFGDSAFQCELQGEACPIELFTTEGVLVGGLRETGCLPWELRNGVEVSHWGVTPTDDRGVFSGVLGVVGLLPIVLPLLLAQLVWKATPWSAEVVQRAMCGELDERFWLTTSTLLLVSITLCATSKATTSVFVWSRLRVSEPRDSTIVGRSVCFHLCWHKNDLE